MPVITINMSKLITQKILVYTRGIKCSSEQIGRILDVQHHPHGNVKDDLKAQFEQVDFTNAAKLTKPSQNKRFKTILQKEEKV
jgi:hypothetical protein